MEYFKDKIILITGGCSGLGEELSKQLLPHAKKVITLDILDSTFEHPKLEYCKQDLSQSEATLALYKKLGEENDIDIAIANAGATKVLEISEDNLTENKNIFKINFFGATDILSYFTSYFKKKNQGHLVAISSIGQGRGIPKVSAYFSSKSALTVFMECLRNEIKQEQSIHSTVIHPGFIKTKMATEERIKHSFAISKEVAAKKILKAIAKKCPDYSFPLPMRILTFINRILPNWLYDLTLKKTLN